MFIHFREDQIGPCVYPATELRAKAVVSIQLPFDPEP